MTHPDLERALAEDFLAAPDAIELEALYDARSTLHDIEGQVSYLRRLVQGRIDILCTEIERREQGGDPNELGELIRALPSVFGGVGLVTNRSTQDEVVPDGSYAAELDSLAGSGVFLSLPEYSNGELDELVLQLEGLEQTVSDQRKQLHHKIDAVQCEIARRFKISRTG